MVALMQSRVLEIQWKLNFKTCQRKHTFYLAVEIWTELFMKKRQTNASFTDDGLKLMGIK